jgi:hypothetical protein
VTAVRVLVLQPQMLQDAADDLRIFDAGDNFHRAAAVFAGLDLDAEDRFEPCALPGHRGVLWHRTALPCPWTADPALPRLATRICARNAKGTLSTH